MTFISILVGLFAGVSFTVFSLGFSCQMAVARFVWQLEPVLGHSFQQPVIPTIAQHLSKDFSTGAPFRQLVNCSGKISPGLVVTFSPQLVL